VIRARSAPSIERRLARTLALWSLFWGLAVGAAIWLAAGGEVDELLDDALQSSADLMAVLVESAVPVNTPSDVTTVPPLLSKAADRFAWQLVHADGRLQARSPLAPAAPWHVRAQPGFSDVPGWRLLGVSLGEGARTLCVAQSQAERGEAHMDVALGAVLASLALGMVGHVWLRLRVRHELLPLRRLSLALQRWRLGPGDATQALGQPERQELQPVHDALEALAARLATRIANEQAFSAHAAHALRTPLAGLTSSWQWPCARFPKARASA
jgi:signal transduction histidine kinase